jgi:hypothetical protein
MNEKNEKTELKEYADGWITERKGTDVPAFLKFAYIIIIGGCLSYIVMYMNGEVNHADRGVLVRAFNTISQSANGLMYAVLGLGAIYMIVLLIFAFRKPHED